MAAEEREESVIQTKLRKFGESTSMKGVARVVKSPSKVLKILWFTSILFGATFAIFQLSTLFIKYLNFNTNARVLEVDEVPEFPDVTLCNINPLTSATRGYMSYSQYLDILMLLKMSIFGNVNSGGKEQDKLNAFEIYSHMVSLTGYFENFPLPDIANSTSNDTNDLIISCIYYSWDWTVSADVNCLKQVAQPYWTPDHNFCVTLTLSEEMAGNDIRGLSLILYVDDFSSVVSPTYTHNLLSSKAKGVRMAIHPRDTFPNIKRGINIPPGHETTIYMKYKEIHELPHPYGTCDPDPKFNDTVDSDDKMLRYTQNDCLSLCYQERVVKRCGCLTPSYLFRPSQLDNMTFCGNFSAGRYAETIYREVYGFYDYSYDNYGPGYSGDYSGDFYDTSGMENNTNANISSDGSLRDAAVNPGSQNMDEYDSPVTTAKPDSTENNDTLANEFFNSFFDNEDFLNEFQKAVDNLQCVYEGNFKVDDTKCECPRACETSGYIMSISQAPWPDISFQMAFFCLYIRNNSRLLHHFHIYLTNYNLPTCEALENNWLWNEMVLDTLMDIDLIEKNFLQVNVLFEEPKKTIFKAEASLTWETLFSNLGGTLNLWVGITFITFIELFELLFEIITGLLSKKNKVRHIQDGNNRPLHKVFVISSQHR